MPISVESEIGLGSCILWCIFHQLDSHQKDQQYFLISGDDSSILTIHDCCQNGMIYHRYKNLVFPFTILIEENNLLGCKEHGVCFFKWLSSFSILWGVNGDDDNCDKSIIFFSVDIMGTLEMYDWTCVTGLWEAVFWDWLLFANPARGGITSFLYFALRLLIQSNQNIEVRVGRISSFPSL